MNPILREGQHYIVEADGKRLVAEITKQGFQQDGGLVMNVTKWTELPLGLTRMQQIAVLVSTAAKGYEEQTLQLKEQIANDILCHTDPAMELGRKVLDNGTYVCYIQTEDGDRRIALWDDHVFVDFEDVEIHDVIVKWRLVDDV